jgi:hypothetical protein
MLVDIQGKENVIKFIEASKLSKFSILRAGNTGYNIPIFECLNSNDNSNAVLEFNKIADILSVNIPYKIKLFDFCEEVINANGDIKIKKSKFASNKMEVIFVINTALNYQATQQPTIAQVGTHSAFDIGNLRADIIKDIAKAQEENLILKEIQELKLKFADLEEEEETADEKTGIGGIGQDQITQLFGLINMLKTNSNPATINGVDENQVKRDNINKAIKILYKYNNQLDLDLLKLSEIAETKTDTFNMLISTLRTM